MYFYELRSRDWLIWPVGLRANDLVQASCYRIALDGLFVDTVLLTDALCLLGGQAALIMHTKVSSVVNNCTELCISINGVSSHQLKD